MMLNRAGGLFFSLVLLAAFFVFATGNISAQNVFYTEEGLKFEVSATLSEERILLGEPVAIRIEVKNLSQTDLTARVARKSGTPYNVEVIQENGEPAKSNILGRMNQQATYPTTRIRPGETLSDVVILPEWVNLNATGLHVIRLSCWFSMSGSPTQKPLRSFEPITHSVQISLPITVLPPDPENLDQMAWSYAETLLNGPDDAVNLSARMLAAIKRPATVRVFGQFLNHVLTTKTEGEATKSVPCQAIRLAIQTLAKSGDEESLWLLEAALDSPHDWIREFVAGSALPQRPYLKRVVEEALGDRSPWVRATIAQVLQFSTFPESEAMLQKLMGDEDETVREAARKSLDARKAKKPQ